MSENRTEAPTPKKREEARKKGQVARSADVNSAAVLLAGFAVLAASAPGLFHGYQQVLQEGLVRTGDPSIVSQDGIQALRDWAIRAMLPLVAPVALATVTAGVVASVLQVRPRITPEVLKPQFSRIDPRSGIRRLFGVQSLVEAAKAIAKTAVIAGAAFVAIWPQLGSLAALTGLPPGAIATELGSTIARLAFGVCLALAALAGFDFFWQSYRLNKQLKMTKEEVKQEARQQDVSPEVRGAIRRRQFQQARKRMLAEVATADVVITNPTHFAVALRYDGSRPAPEVVAKGQDLVAAAIREEAAKHEVPVMTNPPLARALYREVELGQQIPDAFFAAVAEVLAFVYRTAGRRAAARRRQLSATA